MRFFLLMALLPVFAMAQHYPPTPKKPQTFSMHGTSYHDDYTWLENMASPAVTNWYTAQNKITNAHLHDISSSVYPFPEISNYDLRTYYKIPSKTGAYYYNLLLSNEKNETPSLVFRKTIDGSYSTLVNPNFIYGGKVVNVRGSVPSQNSALLAYRLSVNGSDRHEVRFVALPGGKKLNDIIKNVKFGGLVWKGDEGVFYNRNTNAQQFASDSTYQVAYHKVGTDVSTDKILFDGTNVKGQVRYFSSEDGKYLFLYVINQDETAADYYYMDLQNETFELKKFLTNAPKMDITGARDGKLYFSDYNDNWGSLSYLEPENPTVIKPVIKETGGLLLTQSNLYENRIINTYKHPEGNFLLVTDYNGTIINRVVAPVGTDISIAGKDYTAKQIYFYLTSYTIPPVPFILDMETGKYSKFSTLKNLTTSPFPADYFVTKATTYTNRDGIEIPITIIHKKDIKLNGSNPTLLEAYGGFGVIPEADYDTGLLYFLNHGGVYAYAGIRGGGDKGREWHNQGTGHNKINTLNDFIDAAQYLIQLKYTSQNKLGITGASQGGLLVGAALVARPDLFKVAIPKVGVYDMIKFQDYTIGRFHYDEYGNPANADDFEVMMQYSPYHNIQEDVNYPTTLIITSDNDDRVPPVHSYKFAAALQGRKAQTNPVYLKTNLKSGHYGIQSGEENEAKGKSEFYSFLLYHLTK